MSSQPLTALKLANEVRSAGAKFAREVRELPRIEGRWVLADVLEQRDIPQGIGAIRLDRFITAANRTGTEALEDIYAKAEIQRNNPLVRDLTLNERSRLVEVLRIQKLPRRARDRGRRR